MSRALEYVQTSQSPSRENGTMRIGPLYLVAFGITACSTSPHVCTLRGCAPGLLVQISGIANVTAVEAESGGGAVYRHECPGAACGDNLWVLFQDFFPRDVRIASSPAATPRRGTSSRYIGTSSATAPAATLRVAGGP
jgi:hypothetical protein